MKAKFAGKMLLDSFDSNLNEFTGIERIRQRNLAFTESIGCRLGTNADAFAGL